MLSHHVDYEQHLKESLDRDGQLRTDPVKLPLQSRLELHRDQGRYHRRMLQLPRARLPHLPLDACHVAVGKYLQMTHLSR